MSRTVKIFLIVYAIAVTVVAVMIVRQPDIFMSWPILSVATAAAYVLIALGFLLARDSAAAPGPWCVALTCIAALVAPAVAARYLHEDDGASLVLPMWLLVVGYIAITLVLLRSINSRALDLRSRWPRISVPTALVIGSALVVSSLFVNTAKETGWRILARHTPWITDEYNVARGSASSVAWLGEAFAPVGYVFYALAIFGAVAVLGFVLWSRFSAARLQRSPLFLKLTALVSLTTVWVLTDIYWGWLSVFSFVARSWWVSLVAFGCWVSALIFGFWLVRPLAKGQASRLRMLLAFLLPAGTFNMNLLAFYFIGDSFTDFPGLGLLMIGLLLESWSMIALVGVRKEAAPEQLSATQTAG
jgi:hypothetical protein